jgi:hypothetical protein
VRLSIFIVSPPHYAPPVPPSICPEGAPTCRSAALRQACHGRELTAKLGQARVVGETWAERVCRGDHRKVAAWPQDDKALAIARRLVAQLAADPRLVSELARVCVSGAAA